MRAAEESCGGYSLLVNTTLKEGITELGGVSHPSTFAGLWKRTLIIMKAWHPDRKTCWRVSFLTPCFINQKTWEKSNWFAYALISLDWRGPWSYSDACATVLRTFTMNGTGSWRCKTPCSLSAVFKHHKLRQLSCLCGQLLHTWEPCDTPRSITHHQFWPLLQFSSTFGLVHLPSQTCHH